MPVFYRKSINFAHQMKKFGHILLSLLLSINILFIGEGINLVHCTHTGATELISTLESGTDNKECDEPDCCTIVEHIELSPTTMAQSQNIDFHAMQLLVAALPSLVEEWLLPAEYKAATQYAPTVWKDQPRRYLSFIRILLI